MRPRRNVLTLASALAVVGGSLVVPAASSAATPAAAPAAASAAAFTGDEGQFTPTAPKRIMDTRSGVGISSHLGPASTRDLVVTGGTSPVPSSGASTVVFNLTVTNPTSAGFVTAWPSGQTRPTVSNVNFRKGWTGANLVTVKIGTGGKVSFYNSGGTTDLIADVVGWYADDTGSATGSFQRIDTPTRLWDSRPTSHLPGVHKRLLGQQTLIQPVNLSNSSGSANPHIKAIVVSLTVVNPSTSGHLTAWAATGNAPNSSVLNYTAHATVPNLAIVPVAPCADPDCGPSAGLPSINVLNASNGSTDILIDLWGFYDDGTLANGLRYQPLTSPTRIVDTRKNQGATTLFTGSTRTVTAPGSVGDVDTQLLVQNVTSIPNANTFLTLWPAGQSRPVVSNLNPHAGVTVAGLAYTGVGTSVNNFSIYNAKYTNEVLVDVAGTMETGPAKAKAGAQSAWTATPSAVG